MDNSFDEQMERYKRQMLHFYKIGKQRDVYKRQHNNHFDQQCPVITQNLQFLDCRGLQHRHLVLLDCHISVSYTHLRGLLGSSLRLS